MKAFLLAAGLGTRLRPLTNSVPKCLVPIAGRPLLSYWLELFARHGIGEVLINLHHLPEQVRAFAETQTSGIRLTLVHEPVLLGSAGTLLRNQSFMPTAEPFIVAYADNLTNANLTAMIQTHHKTGTLLTMGLFRADDPRRCGVVELDGQDTGRIIAFDEKPAVPRSNLANAGLYVTDSRIVTKIPAGRAFPIDFGRDVLPLLVGEMSGHVLAEQLMDVGTWQSYEYAQHAVHTMGFSSVAQVTERPE